jgi:DNA-binding CsgD family transcriptional regulator
MNSIDIFSVQALLRALEQIHSARELVALPESLFSAVRGLISDARVSIDQLDLKTGFVTSVSSEDRFFSEEMKRKIVELMPSHPVMPAVRAGARGAIRVTDCITQRQFRQTPHYIETLRPIDIHYQMVVTLDIPGKIAGMTVNRDKNFTDKESMLLQLVAPQIALAHRNAQEFTALKRAAAQTIPTPEELRQTGVTVRESEVLHWVIQGKRDCEIATILSASPRTIHNHLRSILRKLNTETRTGAALEAFERLMNRGSIRRQ